MGEPIKCFFVEDTGKRKKFINRDEKGRITSKGERIVWRRTDTGELVQKLGDLPAGAMWFAPWCDEIWIPQLEHVLVVKTPGGDWIVDSQASNCTMPSEKHPQQTDHHCWIIHGMVPEITVDKNGKTCNAGGGSIATANGKYHGFLRNGFLVE
jgi:hypothetical protein